MGKLEDKLREDMAGGNNSVISKSPRISEDLINAINIQIGRELSSFNIYANMANYCNYNGLVNGFKLFRQYAHEELEHMHIFEDYLSDRNAKINPTLILDFNPSFSCPLDVIIESFKHEIFVTNSLKAIAKIAKDEDDFMTYELMLKMIKEQIEEEAKFETILNKIELYKDSPSLNYFIEEEFESLLEN